MRFHEDRTKSTPRPRLRLPHPCVFCKGGYHEPVPFGKFVETAAVPVGRTTTQTSNVLLTSPAQPSPHRQRRAAKPECRVPAAEACRRWPPAGLSATFASGTMRRGSPACRSVESRSPLSSNSLPVRRRSRLFLPSVSEDADTSP